MTQNNIKIAITGGIGSGKSTVAEIIAKQGLPVYSCDKIYDELLDNGILIEKISDVFGTEVLINGKLDRRKLSAIVFNDVNKLKRLNEITHPVIMAEALKKMEEHKLSFCEVPLLFENGFECLFDNVLVILRTENERIKFICDRDKITRDEAILRIKCQFNYNNYDFTKYYVIHNGGNLDELQANVINTIKKIVKKNQN